jgi:hypothetical protein
MTPLTKDEAKGEADFLRQEAEDNGYLAKVEFSSRLVEEHKVQREVVVTIRIPYESEVVVK